MYLAAGVAVLLAGLVLLRTMQGRHAARVAVRTGDPT